MAVSNIPISRSTATSPRRPRRALSRFASSSTATPAAQAPTSAASHSGQRAGSSPITSMTVAIELGPATNGIARGTINGSRSRSSAGAPGCGKIILSAIRNRMMPPAMARPSCEMPSRPSSAGPAKRNVTRIASAMSISRAITQRRRAGGTGASAARNIGTLPAGSMTRKSRTKAESTLMAGPGRGAPRSGAPPGGPPPGRVFAASSPRLGTERTRWAVPCQRLGYTTDGRRAERPANMPSGVAPKGDAEDRPETG